MMTIEKAQNKMAKLMAATEAGAELRLASRRADVLRRDGEEVGRAGYWLVTDVGAASFGRDRAKAEAALERERVIEAAVEYVERRERRTHPDGEFDSARRFYPDPHERQGCCGAIRSPSAAYPYSYMVHCRTVAHVARLHGADEAEVRKAAKVLGTALGEVEGAEEAYARLGAREKRVACRAALARGIRSLGDLTPLQPVAFEED